MRGEGQIRRECRDALRIAFNTADRLLAICLKEHLKDDDAYSVMDCLRDAEDAFSSASINVSTVFFGDEGRNGNG